VQAAALDSNVIRHARALHTTTQAHETSVSPHRKSKVVARTNRRDPDRITQACSRQLARQLWCEATRPIRALMCYCAAYLQWRCPQGIGRWATGHSAQVSSRRADCVKNAKQRRQWALLDVYAGCKGVTGSRRLDPTGAAA